MRHTKEKLLEAVSKSVSIAEVLRHLGLRQSGGNQSHIKKRISLYEIDTSHFLGQRTNSGARHKGNKKKTWQEVLVIRESPNRQIAVRLRRALIEYGRQYKCEKCSNEGEWLGRELHLEVDHINGDWRNCTAENLRFLCPNCHAQETHTGSGTGIVSDAEASRRRLAKKGKPV